MFKIDECFCVNLDRRLDRWRESAEQFDNVAREVTRFSAFSNARYVLNPKIKKHCGLVESNRYLYRENAGRTIGIFEDDVYFSINEPLDAYLDKLKLDEQLSPDWGVLMLGGHLWDDRKLLKVGKDLLLMNPPIIEKDVPKKFVGGSHAVIYSTRALEALAKLTDDEVYSIPCQDVMFQHYLMVKNNFPCYVLWPMIAFQREDFSDLEGHSTKREFIKAHNEKMVMK